MRYLIVIGILLVGCNPLRHYQKVVNDPFRNEAERELLARASLSEFPVIKDTPTVSVVVDSTGYKEINEAYNELLQDYINHVEGDTSNRETDTLFLTKIKALRPATIVKTITKEIPVPDSRKENQLKTQLNACSDENQGLAIQAKAARDSQKRSRTTATWLYIVGGILAIANVAQLFSKKRLLA